ncbi:hypothetical protein Hanom_Chr05g00446761 [Helianthus anomalus]
MFILINCLSRVFVFLIIIVVHLDKLSSFTFNKSVFLYFSLFQQLAEVKKQTVFFLQTVEVWSSSTATDACRCGPRTADVLPLKKQTTPYKPNN